MRKGAAGRSCPGHSDRRFAPAARDDRSSHGGRGGSTRARLTLDRNDRPHIIWINNEDYRSIEYRHWDGEAWQENRIPWFISETGKLALAILPHYTSQMCSDCGALVKKSLSHRTHVCNCGCVLHRDTTRHSILKR